MTGIGGQNYLVIAKSICMCVYVYIRTYIFQTFVFKWGKFVSKLELY